MPDPVSLYGKFLDEWFAFYKRLYGFPPKFTGADGKALKQIISYLQQVSANDIEALSTWQYLLGNWQKMDEFHQRNTEELGLDVVEVLGQLAVAAQILPGEVGLCGAINFFPTTNDKLDAAYFIIE